ncbi:MAG: acyl-CoA dehydrogenase family protein [Gammaproteobacteria bacterium]
MKHLELDVSLSDKARAIQETAIKFAAEVMRPVGKALDVLTDPKDVVSETSKLRGAIKHYREIGLHRIALPGDLATLQDEVDPKVRPLVVEALGFGDAGLATSLCTDAIPFEMAATSSAHDLKNLARAYAEDKNGELVGCWIDVQPDASGSVQLVGTDHVIKDYKTRWVTNGSIATHALLHIASIESQNAVVAVIPLDQPGVLRSDPVSKMGLRALNQCEILLREVKIPEALLISAEGIGEKALASVHECIGQIAVGLAQGALDESIAYATHRIQGGVPIIKHDNIKLKIFRMFAMIESSRAFARSVALYNQADHVLASSKHAIALRQIASQAALTVTSEAIQIFGGPGLMKEYPVEKMLRDAGLLMTINGTNNVLALKALRNYGGLH